jgi:hypothetical protein
MVRRWPLEAAVEQSPLLLFVVVPAPAAVIVGEAAVRRLESIAKRAVIRVRNYHLSPNDPLMMKWKG